MSLYITSLLRRLLYPFAPDPFEPPSVLYAFLSNPTKFLLYTLYHLHTRLRLHPASDRSQDRPLRLVCISDTHDLKPANIPDGDILIHAGDLTNAGTIPDLQGHIDFLSSLPHETKFCIAGNHDTYLDARTRGSLSAPDRTGHLDWKEVIYLQHDSRTLTMPSSSRPSTAQSTSTSSIPHSPPPRTLQVYGAPQIPACGPPSTFAFQYPRSPTHDAWKATIPADTDILITHTPPQAHLDLSLLSSPAGGLGCAHLAREVRRVKPRVHVFGHVHWGAGTRVVRWDEVEAAYSRGIGRGNGWSRGVLDCGLWGEVGRVVWYGVGALVWEWVWGGRGRERVTVMVNAAQVHGNTGRLREGGVEVVDI